MKKISKAVIEIGLVMFLLLTNVLMGFYTVDTVTDYQSFGEKIIQVLTIENIIIAFVAGVISYVLIQKVRYTTRHLESGAIQFVMNY